MVGLATILRKHIKKELILISAVSSNWGIGLIPNFFLRRIPSVFLILSGLTPQDYKITTQPFKFFWGKNDFRADVLVGITCTTVTSFQAYKIADRFRQAGAKVVMGGVHVSALPAEALAHCDSVVVGEAESVWKEVISDYEHNVLKKIYQGQPVDDFFTPLYDYYMGLDAKLLARVNVKISRGCKFNCDFCARPKEKLRFAKIEQVVELMRKIINAQRNFFNPHPVIAIEEDNIFSDPGYAKKLFQALIPLRMRWFSNASVDIAFDAEALTLAKASGCKQLFIGFESIHIADCHKLTLGKIKSYKDYFQVIKNLKSYGIKVVGAFIIGLDSYRHKDYLKLLGFFICTGFSRARFWVISLTILTPYPGSTLYARLLKEERLKIFDWRKYDVWFNVVFRPKSMPALMVNFWFLVLRASAFFLATSTCLIFSGIFLFMFSDFIRAIFSSQIRVLQEFIFGFMVKIFNL